MNSRQTITAFAPATVANVGCGFDVFGFAVDAPGDTVKVRFSDNPGVSIAKITGDNGALPKDASKNTAGVSVQMFLNHLGKSNIGIEIELEKNMPLGSGMGSSAASSVASVVATNELFGSPLKREELLPFVIEGERVACGSGHADNVAPALLGGFVLIRSYEPLDCIKIPVPEGLYCVLVHPDVIVETAYARSILPKEIPLKKAISQWGNTAGVIAALMQGDLKLLGRSLEDYIVEPVRSALIPGFIEVKKAATAAGAIGCSISGSGPSMFALCDSKEIAEKVSLAMQETFSQAQVKSEAFVSAVNQRGAYIIESL